VFQDGLHQNLHHWYVYSGVPHVKRGETVEMRVDTPKSGHTVCLIFGWDLPSIFSCLFCCCICFAQVEVIKVFYVKFCIIIIREGSLNQTIFVRLILKKRIPHSS